MNLPLISFSQDVSLSNPDVIHYFFVFQTEDKELIRIPVQKETMDALLKVIYGKKREAPKEEPITSILKEDLEQQFSEEEDRLATEEEDEFPEDDDESMDESGNVFGSSDSDVPDSEESVPSL